MVGRKDCLGKYIVRGALIGAGIGACIGIFNTPENNSLLEDIIWTTPITLVGAYIGAFTGILTNYTLNRRGNPDYSE